MNAMWGGGDRVVLMRALLEKIEGESSKTSVEWDGDDLAIDLEVGGKKSGYIELGMIDMDDKDDFKKDCRGAIETLKKQGKRGGKVFYVQLSQIAQMHRGKGHGKSLYDAAAKAIAAKHGPSYIAAGECESSGKTSADAVNLWKSIAKRYATVGRVAFVK